MQLVHAHPSDELELRTARTLYVAGRVLRILPVSCSHASTSGSGATTRAHLPQLCALWTAW